MQAKLIHKDDTASVGKAMEKKLDTQHLLPKQDVTTAPRDERDVMCFCMKGETDEMKKSLGIATGAGIIFFLICLFIGLMIQGDVLLIASMVGVGVLLSCVGFVVCLYACCHKP